MYKSIVHARIKTSVWLALVVVTSLCSNLWAQTIRYTDPFLPIYSKGDDLSRANPKPNIIYEEVAGSKVEIKNMPAVKSQDDLGECRAFSLATMIQKRLCDTTTPPITNCKAPPDGKSISSFGMMLYTNSFQQDMSSFQPRMKDQDSMYQIINSIVTDGIGFIEESCKPFDKFINNLRSAGSGMQVKRDKFFNYLEKLYNSKRAKTEAEVADCPECLVEITKETGFDRNVLDLKKALSYKTYNEFLYSLFFEGCDTKKYNINLSNKVQFYPDDSIKSAPVDLKNKVKEVLIKEGQPVLFPRLCTAIGSQGLCPEGHSLVISGFKRVCSGINNCKDVIKVHNSWGEDWQKINNNGWIDADNFFNDTMRYEDGGSYKIPAASLIWFAK